MVQFNCCVWDLSLSVAMHIHHDNRLCLKTVLACMPRCNRLLSCTVQVARAQFPLIIVQLSAHTPHRETPRFPCTQRKNKSSKPVKPGTMQTFKCKARLLRALAWLFVDGRHCAIAETSLQVYHVSVDLYRQVTRAIS